MSDGTVYLPLRVKLTSLTKKHRRPVDNGTHGGMRVHIINLRSHQRCENYVVYFWTKKKDFMCG